jgi:carbon starvation protein
MLKHGKARWVWVPLVPLAWDLVTTMTASWQKVFSDNPAIGYFAQADRYRTARDAGQLLAPAKTAGQMDQVVTNSTTNGVLQLTFAVLVLVVVANAAVVWVRAIRAGTLPTTEVPATPSQIVAPADFFATAEERAAVRAWEESRLSGSGRSR